MIPDPFYFKDMRLILSFQENYLDQGKKLIELLQEMVSKFQWADVVEILEKVQYLLPVFRRKKRVTITREDIDIKWVSELGLTE